MRSGGPERQKGARHIKGFRDEAEIEDRLRDEIDADLADLPFDGESTRLFHLVTFDGQDRNALLIARVAIEAIRRIGARVPANTRDTAATDGESIPDGRWEG